MKNPAIRLILIFIFFSALNVSLPSYSSMAEGYKNLQSADVAMTDGEKEFYLEKARKLFENEYENSPENLEIMLTLGKTYSGLELRTNAKNILMKAYATYGNQPKVQEALGDFNYHFQDYNTALEFYKLALSTGYLRNYMTNLKTAKCYEKLGDLENAKLYYRIVLSLNQKSTEASIRLNSLNKNSVQHPINTADSIFSKPEKEDSETNSIINNLHTLR